MVSLEAVRYCALVLLVSISSLQAYSHGSHPRCTKIPASDVYHGTCYFQFVIGRGYVRKTCPSGTRYSQEDCDCNSASQRSTFTEVRTSDDNGAAAKSSTSNDKSTFLRSLFSRSPLSVMKFLFADNDEEDHDEKNNDFAERNDREENDNTDGEIREADDFNGFRFYGTESERQSNHGNNGDSGSHVYPAGLLSSKEENDDANNSSNNNNNNNNNNDDRYDDASENGGLSRNEDAAERRYAGQTARGYSGSDDWAERDSDDQGTMYSHARSGAFFDKGTAGGRPQEERASSGSSNDDDHDDDKHDDNDVEKGDVNENIKRRYKHGYGSVYSVKGMLSRQKQYHYEDLFANLFDDNGIDDGHDDDDDDEDDDDNDDDHSNIVENYEKMYDEKLDGVLEYVGDIFDDLFDDDFDDFYEDIVDGDGYDDCFVKRYGHYFDEDFESEFDEKYDEFDEFFKNYDRVKALTSRLAKQRNNDDDKDDFNVKDDDDSEDRHSNNAGSAVYDKKAGNIAGMGDDEDKNDDQDENIWSGKGNFEIFENGFDSRSQTVPQDSRLFNFRKTLKQNGDEERSGDSFDAFYEGFSKD